MYQVSSVWNQEVFVVTLKCTGNQLKSLRRQLLCWLTSCILTTWTEPCQTGIDAAVEIVVKELQSMSKATKDQREIAQVGTISANNDTTIGNIIAEAMNKVGKEGVITVEEAKGIETYVDVLPRGELIDGTPVTEKKLLSSRAWTWAKALAGRSRCLFTMGNWGGGDERLWIFDPSKNIKTGEAFQSIASIGSTFLETALGGNRLYFVQYASVDDQRVQSAIPCPVREDVQFGRHLQHLGKIIRHAKRLADCTDGIEAADLAVRPIGGHAGVDLLQFRS